VLEYNPGMLNPEEHRSAIGRRIRWTREALGLKQVEFARRCGISPQALNNYEKGLQPPVWEQAVKICKGSGASMEWIYRGIRFGLPAELTNAFAQFEAADEAKRA
jgi:transcriptional regulator with XRE-family HTH domain